jgi:hypothetical protein
MNDLIRRSTVHFDVDRELHLAEKLIAQAAAPPMSTSRWTACSLRRAVTSRQRRLAGRTSGTSSGCWAR